jgi:hypothetical protein
MDMFEAAVSVFMFVICVYFSTKGCAGFPKGHKKKANAVTYRYAGFAVRAETPEAQRAV